MTKNDETITISKERYEELINAEHKLECLECCGVDNWCGYGNAMEMYSSEDEE